MMVWQIFIFLFFIPTKCVESRRCKGSGNYICCAGFRFNNSTEKCEECPPGYFNWNCAEKCSYPTYGRDCQKQCTCNKSVCSFSFGCIDSTYQTHIQTVVTQPLKKNSEHTLHHEVNLSTIQNNLITKKIYSKSETTTVFNASIENTKTSSQQENIFPTHILYIISCSVAVFVVFFGVYVVITVYRNCFMKRVLIDQSSDQKYPKEDLNYFQINRASQEQQVQVQLIRGNSSENSMYLSPTYTTDPHYEKIDEYDLSPDCFQLENFVSTSGCSGNKEISNQMEKETYLTPMFDRHDYVEVIG